jgi:succinate dehydrogenase (ubiquinone) iron-sulfur subunit
LKLYRCHTIKNYTHASTKALNLAKQSNTIKRQQLGASSD